jgi:hypothetical protein
MPRVHDDVLTGHVEVEIGRSETDTADHESAGGGRDLHHHRMTVVGNGGGDSLPVLRFQFPELLVGDHAVRRDVNGRLMQARLAHRPLRFQSTPMPWPVVPVAVIPVHCNTIY